jgi:hypothetical protein
MMKYVGYSMGSCLDEYGDEGLSYTMMTNVKKCIEKLSLMYVKQETES